MRSEFYLPPRPPTIPVDAEEIWRAVEDYMRRYAMVELPPFSLPGPVAVAASGRYFPAIARRVVEVSASLSTAGTTTTTVEWRKNGVAAATLSLTSGLTSATVKVDIEMLDTDYLTMASTVAGAGAVGLVVHSRAVGTLT